MASVPSASSWLLNRPRPAALVAGGVGLAAAVGALAAVKLSLGLALVGGLALIAAILVRPFIGGIVLVALVPAVSGLAPGMPVRHVRISELLIGAVGVTVLVTARRLDRPRWEALDWLLLVYGLGWAAIGAYDARVLGEHLSLSDWGTDLGQLQFFLLYRGVRLTVRTPEERRTAVRAAVTAATVVAVIALAQEAHLPKLDAFLLKVTGAVNQTGGHFLRATGPFDNWAALAGYLLPLVLLLVALILGDARVHAPRRGLTLLGLLVVALLTTVEASAILSLLIGLIWLGARYERMRFVLRRVGLAVLVSSIVASPLIVKKINSELAKTAGLGQASLLPQTIAYRLQVWSSQYLPAIGVRPAEGYGPVLPSSIQWPYPESQYIALLIEGGVPVLLLFAGMTGATLEATARAARSEDGFDAALGRALLVTGVSLVVMNTIWPYVSNGGTPQMLFGLLAVAAPGWQDVPRRARRGRLLALPAESAGRIVGAAVRS